jgi:hypothetical protein
LFDLQGKVVGVLLSEMKVAGDYFNRFSIGDARFSKGIYLLEIEVGNTKSLQKIFID